VRTIVHAIINPKFQKSVAELQLLKNAKDIIRKNKIYKLMCENVGKRITIRRDGIEKKKRLSTKFSAEATMTHNLRRHRFNQSRTVDERNIIP